MRSLWTRIGLGALAVFAFGMMGITVVKQARNAVVEAVASHVRRAPSELAARTLVESGLSASPATLAALGSPAKGGSLNIEVPVWLDGTQIGLIRHLDVTRARTNGPVDMRLTVELRETGVEQVLKGCALTPADETAGRGVGFRCVEGAEAGLEPAGSVLFEPAGIECPFLLPRNSDAFHSHGKAFRAQADLSSDVRVRVGGREGTLKLDATDAGASLHVTDARGNSVVRIEADENGAFLRIRDRNGRDLLRLDAGHGGVELKADAN